MVRRGRDPVRHALQDAVHFAQRHRTELASKSASSNVEDKAVSGLAVGVAVNERVVVERVDVAAVGTAPADPFRRWRAGRFGRSMLRLSETCLRVHRTAGIAGRPVAAKASHGRRRRGLSASSAAARPAASASGKRCIEVIFQNFSGEATWSTAAINQTVSQSEKRHETAVLVRGAGGKLRSATGRAAVRRSAAGRSVAVTAQCPSLSRAR